MSNKKQKFVKKTINAANSLSLGISIVVAILIGVLLGIFMKNITGYDFLLWLGIFWGVGGAALNIYKAYKAQIQEYKEFEKKDEI